MSSGTRITVLCSKEEYAEIKRQAGLVPLSTWIKSKCIQTLPAGKNGNEESRSEDTAGPRDVSVSRRSTGAAGRPSRVRQPQRSGSRRPASADSSAVASRPGSADDREAVGSKPDGLISELEVLPVKHLATSNWLTCLCPTCTQRRKDNDIPLGGMPPKKKWGKK